MGSPRQLDAVRAVDCCWSQYVQAKTSAELMISIDGLGRTRKEACDAYIKMLHQYILTGTPCNHDTTAGLCVEDRSRDLRDINYKNCTRDRDYCAVSAVRPKRHRGIR